MLKKFSLYWQRRRERFYRKSRWHLILDISLLVIILMLLASLIGLYAYHPGLTGEISNGRLDETAVDLNNPPLDLTFRLSDPILTIGQPVILKIVYKNDGSSLLSQLKINFNTTDKNFLVDRLGSPAALGFQVNGRGLSLPDLKPFESGEVLLPVYFSAKNSETRIVNWQAQSGYLSNGQKLTATQTLTPLKLSVELTVSAAAYYNSPQGDQLGIGPLPPLAGLPTNYWIFWEAKSDGDFKNLVMSAKLPLGVELTGSRSLLSGELKYNSSTRQLIWKVPSLKGQADADRAGFEVQFIPTTDQIGQILPLINGLKYYAADSLTGAESAGALSDLSTNLDFDRFNKGQGKVAD